MRIEARTEKSVRQSHLSCLGAALGGDASVRTIQVNASVTF